MSHDHTPLSDQAPSQPQLTSSAEEPTGARARRPYQKPAFLVSKAFERQALSCAGCLNQTSAFPAFCAMRS